MLKLYSGDDVEAETLTEIAGRPQPVYIYEWEDDEGDTWYIVTDKQIDEDDVESVFRDKIQDIPDYEERDDF